ncbi:hypothetical protein [Chondromyces crocatus]|nr:hypothetical protein [Chondromyces crocatus]
MAALIATIALLVSLKATASNQRLVIPAIPNIISLGANAAHITAVFCADLERNVPKDNSAINHVLTSNSLMIRINQGDWFPLEQELNSSSPKITLEYVDRNSSTHPMGVRFKNLTTDSNIEIKSSSPTVVSEAHEKADTALTNRLKTIEFNKDDQVIQRQIWKDSILQTRTELAQAFGLNASIPSTITDDFILIAQIQFDWLHQMAQLLLEMVGFKPRGDTVNDLREAMTAYQTHQGLPATGRFDRTIIKFMGEDLDTINAATLVLSDSEPPPEFAKLLPRLARVDESHMLIGRADNKLELLEFSITSSNPPQLSRRTLSDSVADEAEALHQERIKRAASKDNNIIWLSARTTAKFNSQNTPVDIIAGSDQKQVFTSPKEITNATTWQDVLVDIRATQARRDIVISLSPVARLAESHGSSFDRGIVNWGDVVSGIRKSCSPPCRLWLDEPTDKVIGKIKSFPSNVSIKDIVGVKPNSSDNVGLMATHLVSDIGHTVSAETFWTSSIKEHTAIVVTGHRSTALSKLLDDYGILGVFQNRVVLLFSCGTNISHQEHARLIRLHGAKAVLAFPSEINAPATRRVLKAIKRKLDTGPQDLNNLVQLATEDALREVEESINELKKRRQGTKSLVEAEHERDELKLILRGTLQLSLRAKSNDSHYASLMRNENEPTL